MDKKYNYCPKQKTYTFLTSKKLGKNVTITDVALKNILRLYSEFDGHPHTAQEIFTKTNISKKTIDVILKMLNFTHASLPFLPNEIESETEEELVEDLVEFKKLSIADGFNRKEYLKLQEDAQKWRDVFDNHFEPIKSFVESFKLPKSKKLKKPLANFTDEVYIVGLSDIHFGNKHSESKSFNNQAYHEQDVRKSFENLFLQIEDDLESRTDAPTVGYLLDLGDVLHSLTSFTSKGTKLGEGLYGLEQFKLAFEVLSGFIDQLSNLFETLHIKTVFGNHDAMHDQMIYYTLQRYFEEYTNIVFEISTSRWLDFMIHDNLIVMEHGNSPTIKNTILPEHSSKRETYINNVFTSAITKNKHKNVKNKIFLCGDKHNIKMGEYYDFEFFRFSTPVLGDGFADEKILRNRPRFNGLIINKKGIKQVINFYV